MTETQRKWLLKYIDKEWLHTDFTYAQDKQDLLEKVIENGEWEEFEIQTMFLYPFKMTDYTQWLILLSPEATAELICKWKGVE